MGRHIFKKPEPSNVRGLCASCGVNRQSSKGRGKYRALCRLCHNERYNYVHDSKRPWHRHKGPICERCGFVPEHSCQLDVDHKDGNRSNNSPDNWQTLCANCHRLKTVENGDWRR